MPMKTILQIFILIGALNLSLCHAQGTFIYDQQSALEGNSGEGAPGIQSNQLIGQSFTPSLTAVGFIRLYLTDGSFNGVGATVSINLRANSIGGAILGSTQPVTVPDRFASYSDFLFSTPVDVTPGISYFIQPVLISGDSTFGVGARNSFNYSGGTAYFSGQPSTFVDLWFREGIVVPEPSAAALILAGLAMTRFIRKSRK